MPLGPVLDALHDCKWVPQARYHKPGVAGLHLDLEFAVPDGKGGFVADFTPQADEALRRFADAGMHVVRSTDPIETWPGIQLT